MLKKILTGIAVVFVSLASLGFVLPDDTHLEREIVINAPQEAIYAIASDLNQHERWSPWRAYDPAMQTEVTGAGVGQKMTWTSKKAGSGSQEITALDPPARIDTHIDFKGYGVASAVMSMSPAEGGTRVLWTFDSHMRDGVPMWMKPISTYIGLFIEDALGKDYETGLANLKREAEAV